MTENKDGFVKDMRFLAPDPAATEAELARLAEISQGNPEETARIIAESAVAGGEADGGQGLQFTDKANLTPVEPAYPTADGDNLAAIEESVQIGHERSLFAPQKKAE